MKHIVKPPHSCPASVVVVCLALLMGWVGCRDVPQDGEPSGRGGSLLAGTFDSPLDDGLLLEELTRDKAVALCESTLTHLDVAISDDDKTRILCTVAQMPDGLGGETCELSVQDCVETYTGPDFDPDAIDVCSEIGVTQPGSCAVTVGGYEACINAIGDGSGLDCDTQLLSLPAACLSLFFLCESLLDLIQQQSMGP